MLCRRTRTDRTGKTTWKMKQTHSFSFFLEFWANSLTNWLHAFRLTPHHFWLKSMLTQLQDWNRHKVKCIFTIHNEHHFDNSLYVSRLMFKRVDCLFSLFYFFLGFALFYVVNVDCSHPNPYNSKLRDIENKWHFQTMDLNILLLLINYRKSYPEKCIRLLLLPTRKNNQKRILTSIVESWKFFIQYFVLGVYRSG